MRRATMNEAAARILRRGATSLDGLIVVVHPDDDTASVRANAQQLGLEVVRNALFPPGCACLTTRETPREIPDAENGVILVAVA